MADSIGLIERAAALLRQREAAEFGSPPPIRPASFSDAALAAAEPVALDGAELILDRGQLASFGITVPSAERSRTAEEFRLLKRNLIAAWPAGNKSNNEHPSRIVMITSSRPGEGKTFVSLNLAFAFASEREVKALLVDVDTHHSALNNILGLHDVKGLVDVLAGTADLSATLVRTNIENLLVLPSGRGGPHVPELLSSSRMSALLDELTRRFPDRFIILDTPPCMASSDPVTLAPLVGQIVFVVEAHRTQQDEIEAGLSMLSPCPRISLLLNKSEQASAHFGSYGYGYHYPTGESDELRADKPAPA
ncbi:MAG TPA: polysaccharide biosynthesis tyrosine autokinase [Stellaceae bacterium]|jgi:receptor protein-tyrosine kinase|nr:polysaccharide biosynthesis tyrosine autokinase [Stellaceae bacterium]